MSSAGAAGAAAAAAMINAVRSFGVIVTVEPDEFQGIVSRQKDPLIVAAAGGFFATEYRYLTSYKGLAFFAKSPVMLDFPPDAEIVQAQKILLPG